MARSMNAGLATLSACVMFTSSGNIWAKMHMHQDIMQDKLRFVVAANQYNLETSSTQMQECQTVCSPTAFLV